MKLINLLLMGTVTAIISVMVVNAQAESTSATAKVGIAQGAKKLFISAGGSFEVVGKSVLSVPINITGIESASVGYATAPYAGSVSSIVCSKAVAFSDTATVLTAAINGVAITTGAVTLTTAAAVHSEFTVTPTAANTVAAYDYLTVTSDAGTNTAANATCTLYITP